MKSLLPCLMLLSMSTSMVNAQSVTPDVITLEEAAILLRTSPETVVLMAQARTIPGRQIQLENNEDTWRFSREAIMAWLEMRVARNETALDPQFADNTREFETEDRENREVTLNATPQPDLPTDTIIGERPENYSATAMFLRDQGVLLEEKQFSLDSGLYYSRQDNTVVVNSPVVANVTIENRAATFQTGMRYTLSDRT